MGTRVTIHGSKIYSNVLSGVYCMDGGCVELTDCQVRGAFCNAFDMMMRSLPVRSIAVSVHGPDTCRRQLMRVLKRRSPAASSSTASRSRVRVQKRRCDGCRQS